MKTLCVRVTLCLLLISALPHGGRCAEPPRPGAAGDIVTLWPLFDYRSSPATGFANLSILGPLFKREQSGTTTKTALRPLFFTLSDDARSDTDILYPLASTGSTQTGSDTQVLKLYQKHVDRVGTDHERNETMLFPFYISGVSDTHGPYTSVFPFYGDIYGRFWRDEYHYALFPLYGRTVKKGTTSTNYLYPFFNSVSGDQESGFHIWPLYGSSAKEGIYEKSFALWPIYSHERSGLDTPNPTESRNLLPFYASSRSPQQTSTHIPWPLCGVVRDSEGKVTQRDILWPFWMTASTKESSTERWLPFYAETKAKGNSSRWLMWPLYREQAIESANFRQEKTSLLYFLFSRSDESWPQAGKERARSTLWPLYAWKRDEDRVRTLSMPALVEPVIWNDGVENNWAPLWRLFIARWDDAGNNAVSLLWNLYWQERRGDDLAWELSPLVSYRSSGGSSDFRLLKGLFGYGTDKERTTLRVLWIPFGW